MNIFLKIAVAATTALCLALQSAAAQNLAGVPGPVVNPDHRSAQYRIGFSPDNDNVAQRAHYQQSINGDLMWRAVLQVRETDASFVDVDYVRGELFWQVDTNSDFWQTGFRFDAQYTFDDRPGFAGALWINQFKLSRRVNARAVFVARHQIGENRNDGVFLQSRANLAYAASDDVTIGVESFNTYGFTENLPAFDKQNHVVGPFATYQVAKKWGLFSGALFGVTDASPDAEVRLWLTRRF